MPGRLKKNVNSKFSTIKPSGWVATGQFFCLCFFFLLRASYFDDDFKSNIQMYFLPLENGFHEYGKKITF